MEKTPLFRPAAVAASRASAYGEIVLARPLSSSVLTAAACCAAAAIVALFVWGTYTKHTTLRGSLVPELGVIEVRMPQYGTIVDKRVMEGALVAAGDTLFVVSSERLSSERGATHAAVSDHLLARRRSIEAQISQTRLLEHAERASLEQRIRMLEAERVNLQDSVHDQLQRLKYAEDAVSRYRAVEAEGFVPKEQVIARQEAALDQHSRVQALERERSRIDRELGDARGALSALATKYASQVAELERAIGGMELEIAENEARRRVLVVAAQSGRATAVSAEVGQSIGAAETLAVIVPEGVRLHAQLFAPSSAVGFIGPGDEVLLRYDAYPYQKFGHHRGTVASVSRAAVPAEGGGAPVFAIVVDLEQQMVSAYGRARALRAGMAVEADVLQETRRLYEWVLEPLVTLSGRIH